MSDVLEQVKQLLEGGIDAAVVLDGDRRVLYYNRAYEALTGLRETDAGGIRALRTFFDQ